MIGILGGSFDPIHFGHINPLYDLSEEFNFDEIRLIPTYISPIDKTYYAEYKHRLNMVSIIASSETNNFIADNTENIKEGVSYTYETIKIIKEQEKHSNICLILGLDVFLNIETWYNYQYLIEETKIIVLNRPNIDMNLIKNMSTKIQDKIINKKNEFINAEDSKIFLYTSSNLNVSSTQVRRLIKEEKDISGLIPGSIASYIRRNNLYKGKE